MNASLIAFVAASVVAIIALAWALPAAAFGGPDYANAILIRQTEERMVYSYAHNRPWWWYLSLLPVLLYPYSFWPPLWKEALRKRAADPGQDPGDREHRGRETSDPGAGSEVCSEAQGNRKAPG